MGGIETIAGIGAIDADPNPELLIELPHGATERRHYEDLRRRLRSPLAENLIDFFFVNTDIGAPECAALLAQRVRAAGIRVAILRCFVPRTFVDCNREIAADAAALKEGGFNPAIASYISDPSDQRLLSDLHRRYVELADRLHAQVCGARGLSVLLHTYAPRSVGIEVEADIGAAIQRAYQPGQYETWTPRPEVEVITTTPAGEDWSPRDLIEDLKARYAKLGIDLAENATYQMHPGTLGHRYSKHYPERVLCIEYNRATLGDPWKPFEESRMSAAAIEERIGALAESCLAWLRR